MMLANAVNLRRAGLLLRAIAGGASWAPGVFVDARKVAKDAAIAGTEKDFADAESYLVDQGWLVVDDETNHGASWYALTRHGLDESQRKLPAEPKPYTPGERAF